MFRNSDYYDLDSAQKSVAEKKLMLDLYIKNMAIIELLKQKGIVTDLDIEACENYVKSSTKVKIAMEGIQQSKDKINEYQRNPEQHLKDLFAAKMNGTIK